MPAASSNPSENKSQTLNVVNLEYSISPLLFGNGVVSFNRSHGLLFGAMVPEDFFSELASLGCVTSRTETNFIKYLSRDLQILLKMPFNHFISHVLCDENLQKTLQTFFLYAPRVYDSKRFPFTPHFNLQTPIPRSPPSIRSSSTFTTVS